MSQVPRKEHHAAHHFDDAVQERDAAQLGMWLFIGQELLFFGGLAVLYIVMRLQHPGAFVEGSGHLSWKLGGLNTAFLVVSSMTLGLAIRSAKRDEAGKIVPFLGATFLLALSFLVVKGFEYSEKIHHGLVPGKWFSAIGADPSLHVFFGMYFATTGLHALHVLIGMGLLVWLMLRARRGHFHSGYQTPLDLVNLYWHTVELIWIFLFPALYLVS